MRCSSRPRSDGHCASAASLTCHASPSPSTLVSMRACSRACTADAVTRGIASTTSRALGDAESSAAAYASNRSGCCTANPVASSMAWAASRCASQASSSRTACRSRGRRPTNSRSMPRALSSGSSDAAARATPPASGWASGGVSVTSDKGTRAPGRDGGVAARWSRRRRGARRAPSSSAAHQRMTPRPAYDTMTY